MKKHWKQLVAAGLLVCGMSVPALAMDFELEGTYEMSGRYYKDADIVHAKTAGAEADIAGGIEWASENVTKTLLGLGLTGAITTAGADTAAQDAAISAFLTAQDQDALIPAYGAFRSAGMTPAAAAGAIASEAGAANRTSDPFMPNGPVKDTVDSDQFLKHVFTINPTLNITEDIAIKSEINVFDNSISEDEWQVRDHEVLDGTAESFDSYSLFRVDHLWAEVMTDFGFFVAGVTPAFQGIGYFVQLPDMDEWTFGLVWDKTDEDGDDEHNTLLTDSDDADEDGVVLLVNYETEELSVETALAYGFAGTDNSAASAWLPSAHATYADEGLRLEGFFRYADGTFSDRKAGLATTSADAMKPLLDGLSMFYANAGLPGYSLLKNGTFAEDFEYGGAWSAYAEAAYDIEAGDMTVTPVATLAYASGAERPNEISGYFDDDMSFGTWLMNDVSDAYALYFETPVSNTGNALGNPGDDAYSFSNIVLVRLGADAAVTDKLSVRGNLVWAQKASTEYLEKWNPELGTLNAVNPNATKISTIGQYVPGGFSSLPTNPGDKAKNKVDKDLGWELNAKADYAVQENLNFAVQASYYAPGSFYESAFEKAFGNTTTGLEVQPEIAARWIATISF